MPMYFVYILQSLATDRFYIGHCDHLLRRFYQHQCGQNRSTKNRGPWHVPHYEIYASRGEAMRRERELKAMKSAEAVRRVIQQATS